MKFFMQFFQVTFQLFRSARKISLLFVLAIGGISIASWFILHNCQHFPIPKCNATALIETERGQALAERYYEYSPQSLQAAHDTGNKVVLYFWAPWCASCASLDVDLIEGKLTLPEDVVLLRVSYDASQELRRKYTVTIQHTFVQVNPDGSVITKWVGGETEAFSTFLR